MNTFNNYKYSRLTKWVKKNPSSNVAGRKAYLRIERLLKRLIDPNLLIFVQHDSKNEVEKSIDKYVKGVRQEQVILISGGEYFRNLYKPVFLGPLYNLQQTTKIVKLLSLLFKLKLSFFRPIRRSWAYEQNTSGQRSVIRNSCSWKGRETCTLCVIMTTEPYRYPYLHIEMDQFAFFPKEEYLYIDYLKSLPDDLG